MSRAERTSGTTTGSTRNIIGRLRGSRVVQWLLLSGGRGTVATTILLGMTTVVFIALLTLAPNLEGFRMRWLFNGIVNGLLSVITIVLAINQLILSRQFGSPRDLYDRLDSRISFREEVTDQTDSVLAPSQPAGFMQLLFRALRGQAQQLGHAGASYDRAPHIQEVLDEYIETIAEQTDRITADLEAQPFEMAGVLAVLDYDDSWQFHMTRRLQTVYTDALTEADHECLAEIRELLKQIDTARQYFKTLYTQRELAQLSRAIVYVGIPAILVASLMILIYRNQWSADLDSLGQQLLMAVTMGIALAPVAVLFSYGLRFATIARRSVVFGPFTPQEEQKHDSDWNR